MYQDKPPIEEVMTLHHAGVGHDGYTLAGDIGNPEDISMALVNKRINMLEIL